jgi:hypothetical protein
MVCQRCRGLFARETFDDLRAETDRMWISGKPQS